MKYEKLVASCPMDGLLRVISGQWTTLILWNLANHGPVRFGKLKRQVPGISSRMLTERLRMLEENALVLREYKPTIPPQVSYSLTGRGMKLREVLNQLNSIAVELGMAEPCVVKTVPLRGTEHGPHHQDAETPAT